MSTVTADPTAQPQPSAQPLEAPRKLDRGLRPSDRVFHIGSLLIGALVLAITGSIGLFLLLKLIPTLHA